MLLEFILLILTFFNKLKRCMILEQLYMQAATAFWSTLSFYQKMVRDRHGEHV